MPVAMVVVMLGWVVEFPPGVGLVLFSEATWGGGRGAEESNFNSDRRSRTRGHPDKTRLVEHARTGLCKTQQMPNVHGVRVRLLLAHAPRRKETLDPLPQVDNALL